MTPHRLSRVYFFVCIQLWRDGEYHYVSENHYEIKIAEIHLFCPVLPGYKHLLDLKILNRMCYMVYMWILNKSSRYYIFVMTIIHSLGLFSFSKITDYSWDSQTFISSWPCSTKNHFQSPGLFKSFNLTPQSIS